MNTQQLEAFIQVAENLNFARASEALNVTQSAVSRQIHALEEELDTKLFYRTTRTVALTPEGIIFLDHAKHILGQVQVAMAKLRHQSNFRTQVLRIGCGSEMDLDFLREILTECRQEIMAFHPIFRVIPHRSLLNLFYQGELEVLFGFQESLTVKKDVTFVELKKVPVCCVVPPEHPYAGRDALEERDLFSQHLVVCSAYSIPAKVVELQSRVAQHISPDKVHVTESVSVIHTLIRTGYGCSILPQAAVPDPSLVYVPLRHVAPLPYGMIYRKNSSDPVLKTFVDITQERG